MTDAIGDPDPHAPPTEPGDAAYGLRGVSVRHDGDMALMDIDLTIETGLVTAVVGGDGAGKTTLLRTLVGLMTPVSGAVTAPDKRRIGYLPAGAGSWPQLSVIENMEFVGSSFSLPQVQMNERIAELLGIAGLTDVRERLASNLSGGMRKKLGFSMALLPEPRLLVLDEPSTGVDPVSRVELWALMSQAAASGTAVVMTTTYMDEAERAAYVLALENGSTLLAGTPADVAAQMPGAVVETVTPIEHTLSWRKGAMFREWYPDGAPPDLDTTQPRLEDAVIVASLGRKNIQEPAHA